MNINFKKLGIALIALFAMALSGASVNKASAKMLKTTSIPAAYRGNWQARYNEAGRRSTASARLYAHSGNVHFPSALISGKMDYTRAGHNYALYPAKKARRGKVNSDVVQPVNMRLRHRRLNIGEGGTGLTWNMYRVRIRHQVRYHKNRASKRRYTKKRVRKPRRTYKKRVRRHTYKTHKRYKKRTVKRAKPHYRHHKVTRVARKHSNHNANIKRYVKQVQAKSVEDVNHDRATKGEDPLSESSWLDHIAGQRAKQLASNFSHINNNGQNYFGIDFNNDGYSWPDTYSYAENIAYNGLGDIVTKGRESYNKNGIDIANAMNDGYFNHDASSNWGHRKNILNNDLSEIGVGAYYDKKSHRFYQAEDFWGGNDPTSGSSNSESDSVSNNANDQATSNNSKNIDQAKAAIQQINQYREENGVAPLKEDSNLDKIAQMRADQSKQQDSINHYDSNGQMYMVDDAHDLGLSVRNEYGENLAINYSSKDANHDMMYNDAGSNWSHRKNILNPDFKYVGTGVKAGTWTYKGNSYNGEYFIAEDFSDSKI